MCSERVVWILLVLYHVSSVITGLDHQDAEKKFKNFIEKYKKPYKDDITEYKKRFDNFVASLKRYEKLNVKRPSNSSAIYGINKFADLTPEEFKSRYLRPQKPPSEPVPMQSLLKLPVGAVTTEEIPMKWDWREHGIISDVRNQGSCGGCWAFSTVETVESMHAMRTKKMEMLSVQQVIDCSYGFKPLYGCLGGDTCGAFGWMKQTQTPLVPESRYPLKDVTQTCKVFPKGTDGVRVRSYTCDSYVTDESPMLEHLANYGPLSVSVDATNWNDYLGGIIQFHCGSHGNNHAVMLVGYDRTGDVPYYIAKNSWGADFGNSGYIYLKYGGDICGVAKEVSMVQLV